MMRTATMFLLLLCVPALAFGVVGTKLQGVPAGPDTSAPDAWGYTWVRSTDPGGPVFNWVDITTRGTQVTGLGDDNSAGPFPIQFAFPYYWYTVNTFRVGSNGYVTFGNQTANFASPFAALPNTSAPNDMLAICTGDLDFTVAAANPRCYYWTNGVDSLVVSYINVTEWQVTPNPNLKHTFQVILNKQDSSIVYQYGEQQGQYNASSNTTLCIGIENQTGQIGLNYTFSSTGPHALMPTNGLAIRIKRTVNTGLQVTDAGIVGGFNTENLAKMMRQNRPDTLRTIVKNFGTANLTTVRVTAQVVRIGQTTLRDTVWIPSMTAGDQTVVSFPRLFTPAVTGTYTATFAAFVPGDVGPSNNSKVTEILSVNLAPGVRTPLAFEGGTVGGNINWSGGGGMAVDFEVPAARVRIESVYVSIASITTQPMIVEILDGTGGAPGAVLGTRSVTAVTGLNAISFRSDSIRVNGGRFFASARGQMAYNYESATPISFRTWEYTNGYAPYRSRDVSDVIIRATVVEEQVVQPPTDSVYVSFTAGPSAIGTVVPFTVRDDSGNTRTLGFGFAPGMNPCITPADTFQGWGELGLPPFPPVGVFDARLKNPALVPSPCFDEGSLVDLRPATAPGQKDTFYVAFQEGSGGRPIRLRWPSGLGATLASARIADIITGGLLFSVNMLTDTVFSVAMPHTGFFVYLERGTTAPEQLASVNGLLHADGCDSIRITELTFTWYTAPPFTVPNLNWFALRNEDAPQNFPLPPSAPGFPDDAHLMYRAYPGTGLQSLNIDTLVPGRRYKLVTDCISVGVGAVPEIPEEFSLSANYPNPFNPSTSVNFSLPFQSAVRMTIYDVLGRRIRTLMDEESKEAGIYRVTWDGTNNAGMVVPSGTYFLRLEAGRFSATRKLLLLK
ncbi:MAG: FlgD immunoglobulin-like domain containing protein [Bacteroidota bacterium]